jgi:hypothetical protein
MPPTNSILATDVGLSSIVFFSSETFPDHSIASYDIFGIFLKCPPELLESIPASLNTESTVIFLGKNLPLAKATFDSLPSRNERLLSSYKLFVVAMSVTFLLRVCLYTIVTGLFVSLISFHDAQVPSLSSLKE